MRLIPVFSFCPKCGWQEAHAAPVKEMHSVKCDGVLQIGVDSADVEQIVRNMVKTSARHGYADG